MKAQQYVDEEEGLDVHSDARSMDMMGGTNQGWLRNVMRRNTQVSPDGRFTMLTQMFMKLNYAYVSAIGVCMHEVV